MGNTARGWFAALRGLRDNPLLAVWLRTEARRMQAKHWFKRSPGLFSLAVVLSLAVSTYLISMIVRQQAEPPGLIAGLYARSWLVGGWTAILFGVTIFALCWLTARVYSATRIALGFLEMEPRQRFSAVLDDMLAVTSLSPQEILLAVTGLCLRLLLPPLALLGACLVALMATYNLLTGTELLWPMERWDYRELTPALTAVRYLITLIKLAVSGVLTALLVTQVSLTLGLLPRSGMMPTIGAGIAAALHPPLVAGGMLLATWLPDYSPDVIRGWYFACVITLVMCIVLGLLFYLARRLPWLQKALGFAWPVLVVAVGALAILSMGLNPWSGGTLVGLEGELTIHLTNLALVNPLHLVPEPWLYGFNNYGWLTDSWRYPLGLLTQLVMVVVMAEFARDSVRRRFQGVNER